MFFHLIANLNPLNPKCIRSVEIGLKLLKEKILFIFIVAITPPPPPDWMSLWPKDALSEQSLVEIG